MAGSKLSEAMRLPDIPPEVTQIAAHAFARLAGGNPNSGFVIGSEGVVVVDAAPTPALAREQFNAIRKLTDAPIRYVLLTHYHAVRVLGASFYIEQGAQIVASRGTRDLIKERGREDMASEMARFPQLFPMPETIKGLVWPTVTFDSAMDVHLGDVEVQFLHLGMGHTAGDAIAWVPQERVCFSGDLVEMEIGVYAADAHLDTWLQTLAQIRALQPLALVPGRGAALTSPPEVERALVYTEGWVRAILQCAREGHRQGWDFKRTYDEARQRMDPGFAHVLGYEHCVAYAVARACDECQGRSPRIWTAQDDQVMRETLPGIF